MDMKQNLVVRWKQAKSSPVRMGFYYDHIVPHLVNLAMRNRLLKAYRERIVDLAQGRVLELGIGPGRRQKLRHMK